MAVEWGRKACIILLMAGWGCASQLAPTGGPADTEPPRIVGSTPRAGALRFDGSSIVLEFSEYVDRRSFQESAFLSPSPGTLRFEWGGREVEISFGDTLRRNTTYILTVGTDLRDTRNNRLASSFSLPFSTGEKIDSCSASGRVDDPSPGGIMVFAFDAAAGRGDTLDPAAVKPDYLTQTGEDGLFSIRNMKEGLYRLMAVRDAFKNLVYNVQTDMYGMASADIRLGAGESSVGGIGFRLAADDTLRPFISGVRARDRASIVIRFNEPVRLDAGVSGIAIIDTVRGGPLGVIALAQADTGGRDFIALTEPHDSGAVYRLSIAQFSDARGNRADSAGTGAIFAGSVAPDTLPPAVTTSIARDSLTGVSPLDTVRVTFSEPVDTASFANGFALLGPDGGRLEGELRWRGAMIAEFFPAAQYAAGGWYTLSIPADSVRDRAGNIARGLPPFRRFRIAEERQLSSIGGDVVTGEGEAARGVPAIVEAVKLPAGGGVVRRVRTDPSGVFLLDRLPEGLYRLSAFADGNGNGIHDCGYPCPVRFAEPFGLYADTLKLRPRWPLEGVRITIGR